MERSMGLVNIHFQIKIFMKGILKIISFMVKEDFNFIWINWKQAKIYIKVNGIMVKCKDMVYLNGQMVAYIKEIIKPA